MLILANKIFRDEKQHPKPSQDSDDEGLEIYHSQDPLNRVIDPVAGSHRQGCKIVFEVTIFLLIEHPFF